MKQIARYRAGHALSYAEYGDKSGYPILIQHGMVASIEDGNLFQPLIQTGRRVICLARPGYGASSPYPLRNIAEWGDIVAEFIAELKLSQFDVLGMSSGAPYSYAIGYALPRQVRNIYVFSGTPALYDPAVQAHWPFPLNLDATLPELQRLVHELFFSNLSEADVQTNAVRDSMANRGFGPALDFSLRGRDWGFRLSEVKAPVQMQHSRRDAGVPLATVQLTAQWLPQCVLTVKDSDVHFSPEALDEFIQSAMFGPGGH